MNNVFRLVSEHVGEHLLEIIELLGEDDSFLPVVDSSLCLTGSCLYSGPFQENEGYANLYDMAYIKLIDLPDSEQARIAELGQSWNGYAEMELED